jgi:hypothetical protein
MDIIFKRLFIFSPFLIILPKKNTKIWENPTLKNEKIFKIIKVRFKKKKIKKYIKIKRIH